MDDLVAGGIAVIVVLFAAAAVLLFCIMQVILWELHALATGDTMFVLISIGIMFILCAGYLGIGHWLHRNGLI